MLDATAVTVGALVAIILMVAVVTALGIGLAAAMRIDAGTHYRGHQPPALKPGLKMPEGWSPNPEGCGTLPHVGPGLIIRSLDSDYLHDAPGQLGDGRPLVLSCEVEVLRPRGECSYCGRVRWLDDECPGCGAPEEA